MANEWVSSKWNQTLAGFCESALPIPHEYANTITSLFILFWGVYGLYQLPSSIHQTSDNWRLVYGLVIAVGIGSIAFHWTLYVGWGLLDAIPMLLSEYVVLFQFLEILLRVKLLRHPACSTTTFSAITKTLSVILVVLALLSVIYTALYGQHDLLFILIFTIIPILFFVAVVWSALDPGLFKNRIKESTQYKCIFRHTWVGAFAAAAAGILRNSTEPLCDSVWWIKYVPSHGIWHFFIGYGLYNLIQFSIFIDFDINYKDGTSLYEMVVRTRKNGKNMFQRLWYALVPVLECKQDDVDDMRAGSAADYTGSGSEVQGLMNDKV